MLVGRHWRRDVVTPVQQVTSSSARTTQFPSLQWPQVQWSCSKQLHGLSTGGTFGRSTGRGSMSSSLHAGLPHSSNSPTKSTLSGAALASAGGRIGPGLDLACLEIRAKDKTMTLIVPESIDDVMDMYINNDMEDRDPYWARPWHSAISMAEELLERPDLVQGKTVVDIGAGLGVGGIAAALAGAKRVVLLDREPLALQCSLMSAMACGILSVGDPRDLGDLHIAEGAGHLLRDIFSSQTSSSSDDMTTERVLPNEHNVCDDECVSDDDHHQSAVLLEAGVLDWLNPVGLDAYGKFDVVIACDVLYEDFSVEPVASLVPTLLNERSGHIILADPPNRTRHNREKFLELLRDGNVDVRLMESGRRKVLLDGLESEVQMLLFQKNYGCHSSTLGIKI